METIAQMKRRHKRERIDLIVGVLRTSPTVTAAARRLGIDRGGISKELREAGLPTPETLIRESVSA